MMELNENEIKFKEIYKKNCKDLCRGILLSVPLHRDGELSLTITSEDPCMYDKRGRRVYLPYMTLKYDGGNEVFRYSQPLPIYMEDIEYDWDTAIGMYRKMKRHYDDFLSGTKNSLVTLFS
jgi:hypothetical protein